MESTNKRVAKNTVVLYIRMFITLFIGMWTSRIVLNALGFTDQGLYNVVGGVVGFLSLVTSSISGSISRYITFELGRKDYERVNIAVRNGIAVQMALSAVVVLLGETVGLWFVCNKLVIPPDRMFAVHVVYQASIASFVVSLMSSVPNALVIAHERMNIFAYVSIGHAVCNLAIALAISYSSLDRLILYALLHLIVLIGIRVFYTVYCRVEFKKIKYGIGFNKDVFIPVFSFAGWNLIGTSAGILRSSGTSVLLNIFGGAIANTINGIANSAASLVSMFVGDFTTAFNPQIIKKYAAGEYESLVSFLHLCSKFSYTLLAVMAVPVMINVEPLLVLWLKKIPEGTAIFSRLVITYSMIECICRPLQEAKGATGDVKMYHIVVGGILLFTLPVSYTFLKLGLPIWSTYIAIIITSIAAFFARMAMLRGCIPGWSSVSFMLKTVLPCILATALSFILPIYLHRVMGAQIWSVLLQCFIGFVWSCGCFYTVACNRSERQSMLRMLGAVLERFPGLRRLSKQV